MTEKPDNKYLTGRILLAMPSMGDPRFHKAVIYMCAHDEHGAMGLVVNHRLPGVDMKDLLTQLEIDKPEDKTVEQIPVLSGGPVETARGFVLHSTDFEQGETIKINEEFSVTGTIDALKAIAQGDGPEELLFILGYAGWGAGQLDEELQQNAWLVLDPDKALIFDVKPDTMWDKAIEKIGIDPGMLSSMTGRA